MQRVPFPFAVSRRAPTADGARRRVAAWGARAGRSLFPAFTLIELLAVVVVIVLLAGIMIGVSGYIRLRALRGRARTEVAMVSTACESYRADVGRYPTSSVYRMAGQSDEWYPLYNSSLLGTQLKFGGYIGPELNLRSQGGNSPFDDCHTLTNKSVATAISPTTYTNLENVIIDPWERAYNYFCTYPVLPVATQATIETPCTYLNADGDPVDKLFTSKPWVGGQVNAATFDFWSYGPNMRSCSTADAYSRCPEYDRDDIANFQY